MHAPCTMADDKGAKVQTDEGSTLYKVPRTSGAKSSTEEDVTSVAADEGRTDSNSVKQLPML